MLPAEPSSFAGILLWITKMLKIYIMGHCSLPDKDWIFPSYSLRGLLSQVQNHKCRWLQLHDMDFQNAEPANFSPWYCFHVSCCSFKAEQFLKYHKFTVLRNASLVDLQEHQVLRSTSSSIADNLGTCLLWLRVIDAGDEIKLLYMLDPVMRCI